MATIADAFLDDFEEDDLSLKQFKRNDISVEVVTIDMDKSDTENGSEKISEILKNGDLINLLAITDKLRSVDPSKTFNGLIEDHPEYDIIVRSNLMASRIEKEIFAVHRHVCDLYASRFPELEQTVLHPVHYARVVREIGNDIERVSEALEGLVSDHIKLSASISSSATMGKPLGLFDIKKVEKACDMVIDLDEARNKLLGYATTRISYVAPNLSALVGSEIAVQLVTLAGGLFALAGIPSCNIQTIGSVKKTDKTGSTMFAKNPHMGVIMKSPIMLECPEEYIKKTLRMLSSKVALAARVDCHQKKRTDDLGRKYAEKIREKIEKWQEPLDRKETKPLPLPQEKRKSKRAGKRYRKIREKYKVTELTRMRNRIGFNINEDRNEEGDGFGMIGKSGIGGVLKASGTTPKIRKLDHINKLMIDRERKKRQRRLTQGQTSGLATSVVMTEVQGMSFINPELMQDNVQINKGEKSGTSTYFGSQQFNRLKL